MIDIAVNKYFGILKDFDFENITRDTFHILIEKEIFDVYESSNCYKSADNNFGMELSELKHEFCDFFLFNNEEYYLKKDVVREMIDRRNWALKAFADIESIKNEIEVLLEAEFIVERKIKVLEENHKKYFSRIRNKNYYPLFKSNIEVSGYESWEDYFRIEFLEDGDFEPVVKYLKGINEYIPNPIKNDWDEYFIFSEISDYCTMKQNEILGVKVDNTELNTKVLDVSKQILLFEKLRHIENWDDLSARKKAKLISLLVNKSEDNIRGVYSNIDKKDSETTGKFKKDNLEVENLIKNILG